MKNFEITLNSQVTFPDGQLTFEFWMYVENIRPLEDGETFQTLFELKATDGTSVTTYTVFFYDTKINFKVSISQFLLFGGIHSSQFTADYTSDPFLRKKWYFVAISFSIINTLVTIQRTTDISKTQVYDLLTTNFKYVSFARQLFHPPSTTFKLKFDNYYGFFYYRTFLTNFKVYNVARLPKISINDAHIAPSFNYYGTNNYRQPLVLFLPLNENREVLDHSYFNNQMPNFDNNDFCYYHVNLSTNACIYQGYTIAEEHGGKEFIMCEGDYYYDLVKNICVPPGNIFYKYLVYDNGLTISGNLGKLKISSNVINDVQMQRYWFIGFYINYLDVLENNVADKKNFVFSQNCSSLESKNYNGIVIINSKLKLNYFDSNTYDSIDDVDSSSFGKWRFIGLYSDLPKINYLRKYYDTNGEFKSDFGLLTNLAYKALWSNECNFNIGYSSEKLKPLFKLKNLFMGNYLLEHGGIFSLFDNPFAYKGANLIFYFNFDKVYESIDESSPKYIVNMATNQKVPFDDDTDSYTSRNDADPMRVNDWTKLTCEHFTYPIQINSDNQFCWGKF